MLHARNKMKTKELVSSILWDKGINCGGQENDVGSGGLKSRNFEQVKRKSVRVTGSCANYYFNKLEGKCAEGFEGVLRGNGIGKRNAENDRWSSVMKESCAWQTLGFIRQTKGK